MTATSGPEPSQRGTDDVLYRLGVAAARGRRLVVGAWLAAVVVGLALGPQLLASLGAPSFRVEGSPSARAEEAIARSFPYLGNEQMIVVLQSASRETTDPVYQRSITATTAALRRQPDVKSVVLLPAPGGGATTAPSPNQPPLADLRSLYHDPRNAYLFVTVSGTESQRLQRLPSWRAAVEHAAGDVSDGAVAGYLVGFSSVAYDLRQVGISDVRLAETVAALAAFLLLLLGLRTLGAAVLPLVIAGAAIVVALGVLATLSPSASVDVFLLTVVTAVGLGVGIDYSVLVVSRFREELATGVDRNDAVGRAVATAGRTVLYSGLALMAAAASLFVMRTSIVRQLAAGAITVTGLALAAALTLLPAVLAGSRSWLERGALLRRRPGTAADVLADDGRWARSARHLMRHPWPYVIGVTLVLLTAAAPTLGLRLGVDVPRQALAGTPSITGLAVLEGDSFAGAASTVTILVQRQPGSARPDTEPLAAALRADPRVAAVIPASSSRDTTLLLAVPRVGLDSPDSAALVRTIRDRIVPHSVPPGYPVLVGGPSAMVVDLYDEATTKPWWVIGLALATSFLFLIVILRSLLLPIKAIIMNLLATGASYGILVVVFQHGLGEQVFGFSSLSYIQVYVPIVVFVFLFGLSLDYEMFLVRRIQEEYRFHGDNTRAVAAGLQRTARPISLAAMIMVVVFGCLLTASIVEIKQLGFALAVAIALDATLIRLILVPALMQLLGRWNWWLPRPRAHRVERSLPLPPHPPEGRPILR